MSRSVLATNLPVFEAKSSIYFVRSTLCARRPALGEVSVLPDWPGGPGGRCHSTGGRRGRIHHDGIGCLQPNLPPVRLLSISPNPDGVDEEAGTPSVRSGGRAIGSPTCGGGRGAQCLLGSIAWLGQPARGARSQSSGPRTSRIAEVPVAPPVTVAAGYRKASLRCRRPAIGNQHAHAWSGNVARI